MAKRFAIEPQRYWCGSQDSYNYVLDASEKAHAMALAAAAASASAAGSTAAAGDAYADDGDDLPELWSREGNVAVVNIQGPLIQGSAGWMSYFGIVGYDDIRNALVEASQDPEVGSILLNISSGGGQVAGLMDLVDFTSEIRKLKPVHTYGDDLIASAAYWLGSNADRVSISRTTTAGSIGVLVTHMERSQQYKEDGIGVTVVRAGKYKAITNSIEPLSEEGRAQLQAQADDLYEQFISYVSAQRGVSLETADKVMGEGRVFLGKKAVEANLIDAVSNYDKALQQAQKVAEKRLSKSGGTANNQNTIRFGASASETLGHNKSTLTHGNTNMRKHLTPEQLAALAAGATAESLGIKPEDLNDGQQGQAQGATGAEDLTNDEAAKAAEAAAAAAAAAEAEKLAAEAAAAASQAKETELVAFLRNELRDANAQAAAMNLEITSLKAGAEANTKLLADLTEIARGVVANMSIALGGNAEASKTADVNTLLAEHARLSASFKEKFKSGGVSSTAAETQTKPKAALVDPLFVAMAKSTADRSAK